MDPIEVDMARGHEGLARSARLCAGRATASRSSSRRAARSAASTSRAGRCRRSRSRARVKRTISEMAGKPQSICRARPSPIKYPALERSSPDGKRLAFQAAGRIYVMDLPIGHAAPPDADSFERVRDGAGVVARRQVDRVRQLAENQISATSGRSPRMAAHAACVCTQTARRISSTPRGVLTARPSSRRAAPARRRTDAPSQRTSSTSFVTCPGRGRRRDRHHHREPPVHGRPAADAAASDRRRRISGPTDASSIRRRSSPRRNESGRLHRDRRRSMLDGTDRQRASSMLNDADEAAVSPDGQWLAFQEGDNVYVMPFPPLGTGASRGAHRQARAAVCRSTQVSHRRRQFPALARRARPLEFLSGPRYYACDVDDRRRPPRRADSSCRCRGGREGQRRVHRTRACSPWRTRKCDRARHASSSRTAASRASARARRAGVDKVIDAKGKTLMPGLIDMHAHHHRDHEGVLPKKNWESAIYHRLRRDDDARQLDVVGPRVPAGRADRSRARSSARARSAPAIRSIPATARGRTRSPASRWREQNIARLQAWGAVTLKQYGSRDAISGSG